MRILMMIGPVCVDPHDAPSAPTSCGHRFRRREPRKVAFLVGHRLLRFRLLFPGRAEPFHLQGILVGHDLAKRRASLGRVRYIHVLATTLPSEFICGIRLAVDRLQVQADNNPIKLYARSLQTPLCQLAELHGWLDVAPDLVLCSPPREHLFRRPDIVHRDLLSWILFSLRGMVVQISTPRQNRKPWHAMAVTSST